MYKRIILKLLPLMVAVLALSAPALALTAGVRATPNQKLAFRTGPSTDYGELYTLPESTQIVAIALEEGNGVPWVLVEFNYNGSRVRAYTGLKRMNLSDSIAYADYAWLPRRLLTGAEVYAAPDMNAEIRAYLSAGTTVSFLEFDGAWCFIEYMAGGEPNRGYVREECFMVDLGEFAEYFPENDSDTFYAVRSPAPMFARQDERSEVLFYVPYDASVAVDFSSIGEWTGWLTIYYGGLRGYGRYTDFSDLRGYDEYAGRNVDLLSAAHEP